MSEIILNARWLIAGIDDVGSVELYENAGIVFKNNMILDLVKQMDYRIGNWSGFCFHAQMLVMQKGKIV